MLLLAQSSPPSPLASIGLALVIGLLSVAMIYSGRYSVRNKTANAKGLEKLMTNESGNLSGGAAVLKGYMILFGGFGLLILSVAMFLSSVYSLIFG